MTIKREAGLNRSTAIMCRKARTFDYAAPAAGQVHLEDVVHSVAKTCRYRCMCPGFYSVAEHSVIVMQIASALYMAETGNAAPTALLWAALGHDFHEAYAGDAPTPQKRAIGPVWSEHETAIEKVTHTALGIQCVGRIRELVKAADWAAYEIERRHIYGWDDVELAPAVERGLADGTIAKPVGLEWRQAERFLWAAIAGLRPGRLAMVSHLGADRSWAYIPGIIAEGEHAGEWIPDYDGRTTIERYTEYRVPGFVTERTTHLYVAQEEVDALTGRSWVVYLRPTYRGVLRQIRERV